MSRIVVIGDVVLDRDVEADVSRLMPDAPAPVLDERAVRARPGGAGLAAMLAAQDGHEVTLVTALVEDAAGQELTHLLAGAGITVVDLGMRAGADRTVATAEKIRLRVEGRSLLRWDRARRTESGDVGPWTRAAADVLDHADAVLVSCYGRGISRTFSMRAAVAALTCPVVWDPHPAGGDPVPGVTVVTPNDAELRAAVPEVPGDGLDAIALRADRSRDRWQAAGVAVTCGARGALYTRGSGLPLTVPAPPVTAGDPCGAGDRFAATMVGRLADGALPADAVVAAVHVASRFVANGGASSVEAAVAGRAPRSARPIAGPPSGDDPIALAQHVRAAGGTVVATGGCFDLVHAGHVHLLEAARSLGDCLVVCLNSDASVRRLKGPDRPVVGEADRAQVLRALACVDGVVVFDEPTPVEVLRALRPHVFAKGGDYDSATIPEAAVVAGWGGQAVSLPYLDGRSTSRLLQEVHHRAP